MFIGCLILMFVLTAIDQIIKWLVVENISIGEIVEVIKFGEIKIFSLTHIKNSGAAWSIMEGKTWFLILLPTLVCLAGLVYMYKIRKESKFEIISLAMLISGGAGNLIDRIRFGEVTDYILFEPINFPIFNFADICVVIGAIMFCIAILFVDLRKGNEKKSIGTEKKGE